jgi:hypothetical protein
MKKYYELLILLLHIRNFVFMMLISALWYHFSHMTSNKTDSLKEEKEKTSISDNK